MNELIAKTYLITLKLPIILIKTASGMYRAPQSKEEGTQLQHFNGYVCEFTHQVRPGNLDSVYNRDPVL